VAKLVMAYGVAVLVLFVVDAAWLSTVGKAVFRPPLQTLLSDRLRVAPAAAFYLLYGVGMVVFAIGPALTPHTPWTQPLAMGALFGLFCYATYDLTNMATLKVWPLRVALIDTAWGAFATGLAAASGWLAARAIG
jgi:uncharacterized membrane protein